MANEDYYAELAAMLDRKRGGGGSEGIDTSVKIKPGAAAGPSVNPSEMAAQGGQAGASLGDAIARGVQMGVQNRKRALSRRQAAAQAQANRDMMATAAATSPAFAAGGAEAVHSAQGRSSTEVPMPGTAGGPQLPPAGSQMQGMGPPGMAMGANMPQPNPQPMSPTAAAQPIIPPGFAMDPMTGQVVQVAMPPQAPVVNPMAVPGGVNLPQPIPQFTLPLPLGTTTLGRGGEGR